jgi:hypothetical protein
VFHVLEEVDCGKFRDEKHEHQGCQMVYFQTKNPNLVTFWRLLQCKILCSIFYGHLTSWSFYALNFFMYRSLKKFCDGRKRCTKMDWMIIWVKARLFCFWNNFFASHGNAPGFAARSSCRTPNFRKRPTSRGWACPTWTSPTAWTTTTSPSTSTSGAWSRFYVTISAGIYGQKYIKLPSVNL